LGWAWLSFPCMRCEAKSPQADSVPSGSGASPYSGTSTSFTTKRGESPRARGPSWSSSIEPRKGGKTLQKFACYDPSDGSPRTSADDRDHAHGLAHLRPSRHGIRRLRHDGRDV